MANNEQSQAPTAEAGTSDPGARPDERTPLLGRDAEQSSSTEAAADGAFSENIRKWRRQRWASLLFSFLLVATIVALTLVFGGQHSLEIDTTPCSHCTTSLEVPSLIRFPSSVRKEQNACH